MNVLKRALIRSKGEDDFPFIISQFSFVIENLGVRKALACVLNEKWWIQLKVQL
jgi:hypothetical protein